MARSVRVQPAGAGQLSYDVTSEAAMTAEDLSKLNPGTFCVTLDTGAIYEAYPTGKTAPPGATTIAAVSGSWVLQTSAGPVPGTPAYNPAWYALTAIYWDPSNVSGLASDANSGATAILPVLTWAEIIRRYGSVSPIFNDGQSVTFHKLSPQPNSATDPVFFSPYLSGGGQAVLLDTLQLVQAAFVSGVVTPKNIAIGGSLLTIATMPAGTVAGQLVYNTTRNSYAFVDSVVGTTATMQQPLTAAVATPGLQHREPGRHVGHGRHAHCLRLLRSQPEAVEPSRRGRHRRSTDQRRVGAVQQDRGHFGSRRIDLRAYV